MRAGKADIVLMRITKSTLKEWKRRQFRNSEYWRQGIRTWLGLPETVWFGCVHLGAGYQLGSDRLVVEAFGEG